MKTLKKTQNLTPVKRDLEMTPLIAMWIQQNSCSEYKVIDKTFLKMTICKTYPEMSCIFVAFFGRKLFSLLLIILL